jgi:hypothetical protein
MLNKLAQLFKSNKETPEQIFLSEQKIEWHDELGYIVDGIVVNTLSERLTFLSNRRMTNFDDLRALYFNAMIINEKIDLEIAQQRFTQRMGNTEENLQQFKTIVKKLNEYYRQFKRDQR